MISLRLMIKIGTWLTIIIGNLLIFTACGGGGGGGEVVSGMSTSDELVLSNVKLSTYSAKAGAMNVKITINYEFSIVNGDLEGGTFNLNWGGHPLTINLGSDFRGAQTGSGDVNFTIYHLDPLVDDINVQSWLENKLGQKSEPVNTVFTQTQPHWPDQWKLGDPVEGLGIDIGNDNKIYVAGIVGNEGAQASKGFVSQYHSDAINIAGVPTGGQATSAIVLNSFNNLYAAGSYYDSNAGTFNVLVTKFDTHGKLVWTDLISTPEGEIAGAITVDKNDNIYVTGGTWGDLDGNINSGNGWGYDIFLTKYDASGNKQWTRQLGSGFGATEIGLGVAADSNSNIYLTGYTTGSLDGNANPCPTSNAAYLIKYDTFDTKQWTKLIGVCSNTNGRGIAIDNADNTFVTGETQGDLDGIPHPRPGSTAAFLT